MIRTTTYLKALFSVRRYNDSLALKRLQRRLKLIYGDLTDLTWWPTANGRSALELVLSSIDHQADDEVIVQAFTCVTAVNPIVQTGFKPVFCDIALETLGIDPSPLESLITPRTKAVIVQHSFGLASPVKEITEIARHHKLLVIEDCAHALGLPQAGPKFGTTGDAAILSFGLDKILETKFGGVLIVKEPGLTSRVEARYESLPQLSRRETSRWLLYPVWLTALSPLPSLLRTRLRGLLARLGWLRLAIAPAEYHAGHAPGMPARLPGIQAEIIERALGDLETNLIHRSRIVSLYHTSFVEATQLSPLGSDSEALLYQPVLCATPTLRDNLLRQAQKRHFPVRTWYDPPLFPRGVDTQRLGYQSGQCPITEDVASRILCLPTDPTTTPEYATVIANELIAWSSSFKR